MRWDYSISITWLVTWASAISAGALLYRKFLRPVLIYINEHDLMWEEYCRRHGIDFRVTRKIRGKLKREYYEHFRESKTVVDSQTGITAS